MSKTNGIEDWEERVRQEAEAILGEEPPAPTPPEVATPSSTLPGGHPGKGFGLLRTPSLDDVGVDDGPSTLAYLRSMVGTKVPDPDHPDGWLDAPPEPPPDVLPTAGRDDSIAPEAPRTAPEPRDEDEVALGALPALEPVAAGSQAEADMLEEALQRKGLVKRPVKTREPLYTYFTLDGSELVEEAYQRPKRLARLERDPMMRDLLEFRVVFIAGKTPYQLASLYKRASWRQMRVAMRQVRCNGIVGTVVRNVGMLHAWAVPRPVDEVFEERPSGRPQRLPERAVRPDGRRISDRAAYAEAKGRR